MKGPILSTAGRLKCHCIRLRRGDDLMLSIKEICREKNIAAGVVLSAVGNAQVNHVVKSVDSPNGTYYAQVINSDQGEMGGDTIVKVYVTKEFDAGIFKISRKPLRLYVGAKDEYKTMELEWIGEDRLRIDSKEYFVKYD